MMTAKEIKRLRAEWTNPDIWIVPGKTRDLIVGLLDALTETRAELEARRVLDEEHATTCLQGQPNEPRCTCGYTERYDIARKVIADLDAARGE